MDLGLLSLDASHSAGGVQWKRQFGTGCRLKPCAAAKCPDVLVVSGESGVVGDGVFGEIVGQRRMQEFRERVRERAMSLEDIASLYDYPLDEFQVQEVGGIAGKFRHSLD